MYHAMCNFLKNLMKAFDYYPNLPGTGLRPNVKSKNEFDYVLINDSKIL